MPVIKSDDPVNFRMIKHGRKYFKTNMEPKSVHEKDLNLLWIIWPKTVSIKYEGRMGGLNRCYAKCFSSTVNLYVVTDSYKVWCFSSLIT